MLFRQPGVHIRYSQIAVLALLMGGCSFASAHRINPLEDKYWQSESDTFLQRVSEPVHEEITQRARACAVLHTKSTSLPLTCITTGPTPTGTPRGNKHDSLIRGVWWNDDPNQWLFTQPLTWAVWMKDGEQIAKKDRNLRLQRRKITSRYYMQYRSHYGDLQFLHAMASADGEWPTDTQENIMAWAEFSYAVATRKIHTETVLAQVTTHRFQEHFKNQAGWTVSYLYGPQYLLRHRDHFQQMALGSLLHMIQDSYSEAHTLRSFEPSTNCPAGRVVQFHSYALQASGLHGAADTRRAWKSRAFSNTQDPVSASATILHYAKQNADWPTVKAYLKDVVFCLDGDAERAGAGRFASK